MYYFPASFRTLVAAIALVGVVGSTPSEAAQLSSVKVTETRSLPKVQPDWPVPRDRNQVFYLQRSTNSNTIVFAARFDANGQLDKDNPAYSYWRRYNTTGEQKTLSRLERALAYGMNIKPTQTPGDFNVTLKPLPQLPMLLRQAAPGKAVLYAKIGGKTVRAIYAYVTVDEGGLLPKVTQITLHGIDPKTGRALSETFRVRGGSVKY